MFRRVFCTILLLVLTAAAVAVMFPSVVEGYVPDFRSRISFVDLSEIEIRKFPFYGRDEANGNFGVVDVVKSYMPAVRDQDAPLPDFMDGLNKIYARSDFMDALYAFLLIAILTIPVYMVLSILVFNGAYALGKKWFFLFRFLWFGIITILASYVTVTATWVMYKTVIYDIVLAFLMNLASEITKNVQIALATTNILTIAVIGLFVCLLLHRTLFRGSIFLSLVGAVLRTLLFVVLVAAVNAVLFDVTIRSVLIILAFVFAAGILKVVLFPDKHTS